MTVNWWAVLLAALGYFILGAVWFTPLFGRAWDAAIGYDRSQSRGRFPVSYYIVPFVGSAISTVVIAVLVGLLPVAGAVGGVGVGASVGLAIAAASMTNSLTPHTPRPYVLGAITGGYHLVGCALAGVLIGWLG